MSGNVSEWCQDKYTYHFLKDANLNVRGEKIIMKRVFRGGIWISYHKALRCSYRHKAFPDRRYNHVGFRLVRTP